MPLSPNTDSVWPDDIHSKIRSPSMILNIQADALTTQTGGILEGDLRSMYEGSNVKHIFGVVAKILNHRRTILVAVHSETEVYPVEVSAECFGDDVNRSVNPIMEFLEAKMGREDETVSAASDYEFLKVLRRVFDSPPVKAAIVSLIALSNEKEASVRRLPAQDKSEDQKS